MGILDSITSIFQSFAGYIQDEPDVRDLLLSARLGESAPLKTASIRTEGFVRTRQAGGSCTGGAIGHALQGAYLHRGVACPPLSILYNYYFGRMQWQEKPFDGGSQLRFGIRAARAYGACDLAKWPSYSSKINTPPSWEAVRDGYHRRGFRGYYRIASGDLDGCKRAISNGFPLIAGWDVDDRIRYYKPGMILEPMPRELGGHAMAIFSYDSTKWMGPNTYQDTWGHDGWWAGSNAFMRAAKDIWAIDIEVPS